MRIGDGWEGLFINFVFWLIFSLEIYIFMRVYKKMLYGKIKKILFLGKKFIVGCRKSYLNYK